MKSDRSDLSSILHGWKRGCACIHTQAIHVEAGLDSRSGPEFEDGSGMGVGWEWRWLGRCRGCGGEGGDRV